MNLNALRIDMLRAFRFSWDLYFDQSLNGGHAIWARAMIDARPLYHAGSSSRMIGMVRQ